MLNQPTFEKLVHMRLSAMALAFRQQTEDPGIANLSFEERFGMIVDVEYWSRHNNHLGIFIMPRWSSLRPPLPM